MDDHQRAFGTFIHRVLSAVDVQGAMRGVMAILTVALGLLLLVSAKHAGILPEGLVVKAAAREATQRQAGLDASSPRLTFEAARWRAFLDSLERYPANGCNAHQSATTSAYALVPSLLLLCHPSDALRRHVRLLRPATALVRMSVHMATSATFTRRK
jgi:hypothetical protein